MPHQAHLPKAASFLQNQGRQRSAVTWLAQLSRFWLLGLALAVGLLMPIRASQAQQLVSEDQCQPQIDGIYSIQAPENPDIKPDKQHPGWIQLNALPDRWTNRWPDYSGTVWYRIEWQTPCVNKQPLAFALNKIMLAGEVYLDNDLLWQDEQLTEPLSLSWNMPRYWILPQSLTAPTTPHTFWVRVTGPAETNPGLGAMQLDSLDRVLKVHQKHTLHSRDLIKINMALSGTIGCLFFFIWLLRRKETLYGWYAFSSLFWVAFISHLLMTSSSFFGGSLQSFLWNHAMFLLFTASYCTFIWRFGNIHVPRLEKAMWWFVLALCFSMLVGPLAYYSFYLALGSTVMISSFILNCLYFQLHAWRTRLLEHRLFALCLLIYMGTGTHDLLALLGILTTSVPLTPILALIAMVAMSLVIAMRLTGSIRRIEAFNHELKDAIEVTRTELSDTLQREHALEVSNVKLKTRLDLAYDLHDGLGNSLVRSIAMVEHADTNLRNAQMLSILKLLRDDLRHVIDGGAGDSRVAPATPGAWIAPLRHRFMRILDEMGVNSGWHMPTQWPRALTDLQLLGLQRFLEEALTNIIKHSRAKTVSIKMQTETQGGFLFSIEDDGIGFDSQTINGSTLNTGLGMRSMRERIQRIGGTLEITSKPGCTRLIARFPPPH